MKSRHAKTQRVKKQKKHKLIKTEATIIRRKRIEKLRKGKKSTIKQQSFTKEN